MRSPSKTIKIVAFFVIFSSVFFANSQNEINIDLNWGNKEAFYMSPINSNRYAYPVLENSFISEGNFLFLKEFERNNLNNKWSFDLINFETEDISESTKKFLQSFSINIPNEPEYAIKNNSKSGVPIAVLSLVPFVNINGVIKKITQISFTQTSLPVLTKKSNVFTASSVLREGSGEWYKISVKNDGIHKIDYDFLKSIGVNTNNLNPDHINIYGNAFGLLPELNSVYRPDDLLKNDILVVGDEDKSFDNGDYILFYGKGPHKWVENSGYFERILNIYSDYSAYYININPNNTPGRVKNVISNTQNPTNIVTSYSSYGIHEEERINILRSGQRWYGEEFDAHLTQTFSIHIPDLDPNADAIIKGAVAGKIFDKNSSFTIKYNNTELGTMAMSISEDGGFTRNSFTSGKDIFKPSSSTFPIQVTFNKSTPNDVGYLDYLEVNARSLLKYFNGIQFQDLNSVGIGNISTFQISNFPAKGQVWEITNATTPKVVLGEFTDATYRFTTITDSLKKFIAFDESKFLTPAFINKVEHQNLHGLEQADYLIVTHPLFLAEANRLADLHKNNGLKVHVITTEQIYNEFSGGTQDPTAIKFFAKMFYDRAKGNIEDQPKYLLLFGRGTYDPLNRISNNNYLVPVYETINSESYITSTVSDDYFGFLDDEESFSPADLLDIAVGRLNAGTKNDANILINKIEHYMKNGSSLFANNDLSCGDDGYISTHGDWRQRYTVIGDDEEGGYFIKEDLEPAAAYVEDNYPEMNVKKIYLDAYPQITTAGGERYPEVNNDINRAFNAGSLVTCFVGHGGPASATSERVMTVGSARDLKNIDKLTLFVSGTCEFARIDDTERISIGEWLSLNEVGGAIALMTTSRAILFSINTVTTESFFKNVFERDANNEPLTFGEIILRTKNSIVGGSNNKRSFVLLGDPALKIALPYQKIVLDSINQTSVNLQIDTLKALSKIKMSGHIEDQYGNILNDFNGIIQPSIYDKPNNRKTLGQDATSPVIDFQTQESILFKGKATVSNGYYSYEFIVPKDINYSYGNGKASFYSWSENDINAGGYSKNFMIGGIDTTGLNDKDGPEIELYLNDFDFVNGGLTNENPILIARLFDESGINTVGNGIGHDIVMILDDQTNDARILNEYYESDLDTYKSGEVRYQMGNLKPGLHTLTLKVWDVNNNSGENKIEFNVQEKTEIALDHVLNYPNPFTTHTEFFFEHNQVCSALETQIEIFTVTGRLIKTINETVETRGFRTEGIVWDGRDDFGDPIGKGVYVYRITVRNPNNEKAQAIQKLYILK